MIRRIKNLNVIIPAVALMGMVSGCLAPIEQEVTELLVSQTFTYGNQVNYAGSGDPLAGVVVTYTAPGSTDINGTVFDGTEYAGSSDANGLWEVANILPGAYFITFALAGYETDESTVNVTASGETDTANQFRAGPAVSMSESFPIATVSGAITATLENSDAPRDGFDGNSFVYVNSTGGDIVVTFDQACVYGGSADADAGAVTATADATDTVYTIAAADIAALNGNTGFTDTSADVTLWIDLTVTCDVLTPLHGDRLNSGSTLDFNAQP